MTMNNAKTRAVVLAIVAAVISGLALAADPPGKLKIDKMVNLYEATDFDHKMHTEVASDCKTCHHKDDPKTMACSGCHKVELDEKNLAVIGFKGAMHQQCMGCHKENGVKDTCTSCHAKKQAAK